MRLPSIKVTGLLLAALALAAGLVTLALVGPPRPDAPLVTPKRLALLVGCTKYQHPDITELYGPANDVALFADLLRSQFSFVDAEITQLAGWPDDGRKRPTYANIVRGFESLIERAGDETQVVVLMAGHGVQVPIPETQLDPLDPKNPEPDGMDEVFLPADVRSFGRDGLENAIRDDQFGVWLDRLRDKGAAVWIVFDCCHAGDMMRGDPEQRVERPRFIDPGVLGVTRDQAERAQTRAKEAVAKQGLPAGTAHGPVQMPAGSVTKKGSVVAFYAAQAFEKAPELPCPEDAPRTPKNYFGLMSYTLASVLRQSESSLTYHELARALVARYDAERGQRGPTPGFDGDLHARVLSGGQGSDRSPLLLEPSEGKWYVSGGLLHGLTVGSVLAVHHSHQPMHTAIGHVRVVSATIDRVEVTPCASPDGKAAVGTDRLPYPSPCRLVARDLGDMRLKLFVHAADEAGPRKIEEALAAIDPEYRELFTLVKEEATADWVLWVERDEAKLRSGAGMALLAGSPSQRDFARYTLADEPASLSRQLAHDFQAIFTWRNLWRIAGAVQPAGGKSGLAVEVHRLKEVDGKQVPDTPLPAGATLRPPPGGTLVELSLDNQGTQHLWVTVLALGPDMSIHVVRSLALEAGKRFALKGKIENNPAGKEGLVVLAVPQELQRTEPNYRFLQQDGLNPEARGPVARSGVGAPRTPFGELLQAAALGKGRRSHEVSAPSNPLVYTWSWTTLPARRCFPVR
jgi:hypothetical protein